MNTFGECSFTTNGRRLTLRGDAEFEGLGGLETQVEGNMDGTVFQTAKTTPVMLKVSFEEEQDTVFSKADLTTPQDVTFVEEQNGRVHLLSNAKIAGKVTYNPADGKLSGVSFGCAERDYQRR